MVAFQRIRGVAALVTAPIATLAASVAAIVLALVFRWTPSRIHRIGVVWGRLICRVSGVQVGVESLTELEDGRPCVFAANHLSQFDIFAIQGYLGRDFRWLAKKELFRVPLFGRGMLRAGYIPIDRSRGREALRSINEAAERIAGGASVIIFPEGTRSRDGVMGPFKAGVMLLAIKAGVPVVPVGIDGTFEVLPPGRLLPRPGRVRIRVGAPIDVSGYRPAEKQVLAEVVRGAVASLREPPGAETPAATERSGDAVPIPGS